MIEGERERVRDGERGREKREREREREREGGRECCVSEGEYAYLHYLELYMLNLRYCSQ